MMPKVIRPEGAELSALPKALKGIKVGKDTAAPAAARKRRRLTGEFEEAIFIKKTIKVVMGLIVLRALLWRGLRKFDWQGN